LSPPKDVVVAGDAVNDAGDARAFAKPVGVVGKSADAALKEYGVDGMLEKGEEGLGEARAISDDAGDANSVMGGPGDQGA